MDITEIHFQIRLNCTTELADITSWFRGEWQDLGIPWRKGGITGEDDDNWYTIEKEYEDPPDPNTKYYLVQVISKHNSPTPLDIEKQVTLVQSLIARLTEKGCDPELVSFDEPFINRVLQA